MRTHDGGNRPARVLLSLVSLGLIGVLSGCGGGSGTNTSGVNSFAVSGIADNSVGAPPNGGVPTGAGVGDGYPTQFTRFVQAPPSSVTALTQFTPAVQVAIEDQAGNILTSSNDAITLGFNSPVPSGATLSTPTGTAGLTVNAVNGIATFTGLSISLAGAPTTASTDTGNLGLDSLTATSIDLKSTKNLLAGQVIVAGTTISSASTDDGAAGLNAKSGVTSTTIHLVSTTGMLDGNVLVVGSGTATPEQLLITGVTNATSLAVTRGFNGTTAQVWPSGVLVQTVPEQILIGTVASATQLTGCSRGFNGTTPFAWRSGTAIGVETVTAQLLATDTTTNTGSVAQTASTASFTVSQPQQLAYVATSTGIDAFTVASGVVSPLTPDNVTSTSTPALADNGGNVSAIQGLAVAPNGAYLVAAINSGTAATSGLQVFSINAESGALTAGTLLPVGNGTGDAGAAPAGPIGLDPASAVGVFADVDGNLEAFTVSGTTVEVTSIVAATNTINSLSIALAGVQDVVVQGAAAGQGVSSYTLSPAGALAAETNLGTAAANPGKVAVQGAVATLGETGVYLTTDNTSVANTNNNQTFTIAESAALAGSGQSQLQPNAVADAAALFNSANLFLLGGAEVVETTTAAPLGATGDQQSVFLVPFASLANDTATNVSTATTIQQPVTGVPAASAVVFPPVAGSASATVLVVSNKAGTLTMTPYVTTSATSGTATLQPGSAVTVENASPATGSFVTGGTAHSNPDILGISAYFF